MREFGLIGSVAFFFFFGAIADLGLYAISTREISRPGSNEEEILGKITDVLNDSLEKNDTFDLSGQMGILLDLMQTYETYAAVLLSDHGDPHFATRLKEVVWPLLNRYFVPSEGHDDYEMALLADFYLSGLLASVIRWLQNPKMTLEEFLDFMVGTIFPIPDSPQSYNSCGKSVQTPADKSAGTPMP